MRRAISLFVFMFTAVFAVNGQQHSAAGSTSLKLRTIDTESESPVSYVSVYLIPFADSTITNFALTDGQGLAEIRDIRAGRYTLHAGLIGYKPYVMDISLDGQPMDIGDIRLEEDTELIDASTVIAVGNPVVMKKDLVEFSTSVHNVSETGMLEDLLRRMPGMDVSEDGTVKVNGKKVSRITVEGKTFFFNDPSMALKNIPAKIVEKVKVMDVVKDVAGFTGAGTSDETDKVIDLLLKEEYRKGWFGNAEFNAGLTSDRASGKLKALFAASALMSAYDSDNQLTVIGNARNADSPDAYSAKVSGTQLDVDGLAGKKGINTNAQAGVNLNSTAVKGASLNAALSYGYNSKDVKEKSLTTSFMGEAPDMRSDSHFEGIGSAHELKANFFIRKANEQKVKISLKPMLTFSASGQNIMRESATESGGLKLNTSQGLSSSDTRSIQPGIEFNFGLKNLGKEGRSVLLKHSSSYRYGWGSGSEKSRIIYGPEDTDMEEDKNLLYGLGFAEFDCNTSLNYVEPLGEFWKLRVGTGFDYVSNSARRDAFNGNDGAPNKHYSSFAKNDDSQINGQMLLQYRKEDFRTVLGVNAYQDRNVSTSENSGHEFSTGQDLWRLNWAPYLDMDWRFGDISLCASYGGYSKSPTPKLISPTADISNPTRITIGNIYLRPEFQHFANISLRRGNPKKYSFLSINAYAALIQGKAVYASWFDASGIRCAIPVNSEKPAADTRFEASYSIPFGPDKRFKFDINGSAGISITTGYQASATKPALSAGDFDYNAIMDSFWGKGQSGSLFYSGRTGFGQSLTGTLSCRAFSELSYNSPTTGLVAGISAANSRTKYSLDPKADMSTWDFFLVAVAEFRPGDGWNFTTKGTYNFYRGYSTGYGEDPNFIWNAEISKRVGPISLSVKVVDILNQKRSLSRTTSAEYMTDTYHNTLGRFVLFGVIFSRR